MARKPTKAELRTAMYNREFTDEEFNDPRVLAARRRLQEERQPERADFSDVEVTSSTLGDDVGRTSLDRFGTAARAGAQDILSDFMFGDVDAAARERLRLQAEEERIRRTQETNAFGRVFGRGISDPLVRLVETDPISPLIARAAEAVGGSDLYRGIFESLSAESQAGRQDVAREVQRIGQNAPIRSLAERALLDVAGSPQSLASIPGGPFAAIPAMTTFNDEYRRAREAGLTPEEAANRAENQAIVEGGISAIPAGRLFSVITRPLTQVGQRVTAPIRSQLADVLLRAGRTAAGEAVEESTQYVASQRLDAALALDKAKDERTREFAANQLSQDLFGDTLRAGLAGVAGGGSLGGLTSSFEVARENGQIAAAAIDRTDKAIARRESERTEAERVQRESQVGGELFTKRMNELLLPADQRTALENELTTLRNRTTEAPMSGTQAANIVDQRLAALEEAAQGRLSQDEFRALSTERNELEDAIREEDINRQSGMVIAPENRLTPDERSFIDNRRIEIRNLLERHRTASDAGTELSTLRDRLGKIDNDSDLISLARNIQPRPVGQDRNIPAQTQRANEIEQRLGLDMEGQMMQRELQNLQRPAPTMQERDLAALSTGTSRRKPAKVSPKVSTEEALRAAQEADLRSYANTQTAPTKGGELSPARSLVQNLAKNRGTADAKRALMMIGSGRVEVVNSLQDLGLEEVEGAKTRGAELNGKIYLVADSFDKSKDMAPQLAATIFHETKHVADFGRGDEHIPANLAGFIGMDNARQINTKIEAAAQRGNKLAQIAVADAGRTGVYEEELLPHFISQLKLARNKASGVANVMSDIRSAVARGYNNVIGLATGRGNEVSIEDVYKLSQELTDYVTQNPEFDSTPRTRQAGSDRRMILGQRAAGFATADELGLTYTSKDGGRKYYVSDRNSDLRLPNVLIDRIQKNPEVTLSLGTVLKHDDLYREYPELKDVLVRFKSLPNKARGQFNHRENIIDLNKDFVQEGKYNGPTHQILLHELQHAIQNIEGTSSGTNPSLFLPASYDADKIREQELRDDIVAFAKDAYRGSFKKYGVQPTDVSADVLAEAERVAKNNMPQGYDSTENQMIAAGANALSIVSEVAGTQSIRDMLAKARELQALNQKNVDTYQKAYDQYFKNLGEEEARFTQNNITLPDDEAPINPESVYYPNASLESGRVRREALSEPQRQEIAKNVNKVRSTIAGFASAYGKLGKEAGQIAEAATGETSYYSDLGFTTGRLIEQGINDVASRWTSEGRYRTQQEALEKAHEMVKARIENLNNIDSDERRQAAIAGLVREHPELSPLQDAYNIINDNTRIIIRNMLSAKTGPLTDLEIQKMNTLRNNTTRYLTTVYGLFQGKDGTKWANRVAREYAVAKAELEKGNAVPEKARENYEIYKNALDYVIRNEVAVFDPERLAKLPKEKIDLIYDTWYSNRQGYQDEVRRNSKLPAAERSGEVRQALIDRIIEKGAQVNGQQIENRANTIVRGLLGLNNSGNAVAQYYRGFKQDKGILMDRTHIPEQIRALFDEITDPALRVMMTISRQGELIARTKILAELKDSLYGNKIISNEDKADDTNNRFTEQLRGESWGPLEGFWVTPEIFNIIDDAREIAANMEGALGRLVLDSNAVNNSLAVKSLRAYTKLAGYQKLAAIVWNPAQTMWNLGGSWISLIKEGNVDPRVMLRATKAAGRLLAKELRNAGLPRRVVENDQDVADLIRYDVIDSAMVQELRQMPFEYSRQAINSKNPILGNFGKGLKVTKAGVTQLFALSDLTAKIANYFNQVDTLTKYYQAEGINKTPDAIKREAANIIKDTNITFRRTAPVFKMSERLGLTYVMPYIQGVFRSSIYGYVHGVRDIVRATNEAQTAEGRNILLKKGMGRIAGSSVALFAIQALAKSVLTGDEEKDAKIRQLQYADARYGDSVYVGDDAKGNPMMLRLSRFDPYGPLTDILRIISSDATPEQKNRDTVAHLRDLLIKPRLGQQLLASAYEFVSEDKTVKSKQTKLERVFPQATELTKDFIEELPRMDYADGEQVINLLDTLLPGATNIVDPGNTTPAKWSENELENNVARFLTSIGGRLDTINPKAAAVTAGQDLKDARMEARERVFNRLSTVNPNDRQAVVAIMDGLDAERKAFLRLKEVYEGMQALGMSKSEIDEVLKEQAKVNNHDRHLLYSGKYDTSLEGWKTRGSSVLSKKSINQRNKVASDKEVDPVRAAQREESIKRAVKVLREAGYKVKE